MSEVIIIILAKTMLPEHLFFLKILSLPLYYLVPGRRLVYFTLLYLREV